jgi:hypothetical protein
MEPNKKFRKEAQTVKKKANSFRLLTGETGGSYFSTKMDASRQDCAIPLVNFLVMVSICFFKCLVTLKIRIH